MSGVSIADWVFLNNGSGVTYSISYPVDVWSNVQLGSSGQYHHVGCYILGDSNADFYIGFFGGLSSEYRYGFSVYSPKNVSRVGNNQGVVRLDNNGCLKYFVSGVTNASVTVVLTDIAYYQSSTGGVSMGEQIYYTNSLGYVLSSNVVDQMSLQLSVMRDQRVIMCWIMGVLLCVVLAYAWQRL